jgi:hypothetical protein
MLSVQGAVAPDNAHLDAPQVRPAEERRRRVAVLSIGH